MWPNKDPELPIEPPEDKIVGICYRCGGDVYEGEMYRPLPNGYCLCPDCIREMMEELGDESL